MGTLLQDLRFALRMLAKNPGFTAVAVITLALCIGVNTAVFSVIDEVLLRPLPYPEPDRLATVVRFYKARGTEGIDVSQDGRTWQVVRENATYLDCAAVGGTKSVNLVAQDKAGYVLQQRVSAGFFRVLGVKPILGREFTGEEDRVGGPPVTILSYGLWKRLFNVDRSVMGRGVTLRGEPYTIVGAMPQGFETSAPADLWTPLRPSTTGEGGGVNYQIVARLRPGVTWVQADSQIASVGKPAFEKLHLRPGVSVRLSIVSLQRGLTNYLREPLFILWAAVGVVLLIGCVNIAGLLLGRGAARRHEFATRMALGAGRAAVVRQLLTESLLLGLFGGAAGTALGYFVLQALRRLLHETLNIGQSFSLDMHVLVATAGVSLLTSVLFGLMPALEASRLDVRSALVESGARGIAGSRQGWSRRWLVITEVALGVVLLAGAGLLIRTFMYLYSLRPGFDPTNVITATLSLQDARYATAAQVNRLFDESLARIRELPGVESAAVGLTLPYERALNVPFKRLDGPTPSGDYELTNMYYVTPDYFQALRIPLLRGRAFSKADGPNSAPVVIVNEAFAKRYLSHQEPVGSHLGMGGAPLEIVGVVGDVQEKAGWGNFGPLGRVPAAFIPAAQTSDKSLQLVHTWFSPSWIVRAKGSPEALIPAIKRAVESIDPQLPFASFRTMEDVRSSSLAQQRSQATLLGIFAGLALLLAAVGVYGLLAYAVTQRTHEIGIRMALGAGRRDVLSLVLGQGLRLALIGTGIGLAASLVLTRFVRSMLFGVRPNDPVTLAGVALTLTGVALLASYVPARRATKVDPMVALRYE